MAQVSLGRSSYFDWTPRRLQVPLSWLEPFRWPEGKFRSGPEGNWSTFPLSIGTPGQNFDVLLSTTSRHLSLHFAETCSHDSSPDCGLGFDHEKSSTWWSTESSDLGEANYWENNVSDGDTQKRVKIEAAQPELGPLGVLGLGQPLSSVPRTFLYRGPYDSLLGEMVVESWLSYSYGYTAGAAYRNASASFLLGGYDAFRLGAAAHSFSFSNDPDLPLIAQLASLTVESQMPKLTDNTLSILETTTPILLDPASPYYVLPKKICDKLTVAFGLEYEHSSGLFMNTNTTSQLLRDRDSSLDFHFEDESEAGHKMVLSIPFNSLDINIRSATEDIEGPQYFPLKVAADGEMSVLGRAFFQEVYLVVDYERRNFTIAQCTFSSHGEPTANATAIIMFRFNGSMLGINLAVNLFILMLSLGVLALAFQAPLFLLRLIVERSRNRILRTREQKLERLWTDIHTERDAPENLLHDEDQNLLPSDHHAQTHRVEIMHEEHTI